MDEQFRPTALSVQHFQGSHVPLVTGIYQLRFNLQMRSPIPPNGHMRKTVMIIAVALLILLPIIYLDPRRFFIRREAATLPKTEAPTLRGLQLVDRRASFTLYAPTVLLRSLLVHDDWTLVVGDADRPQAAKIRYAVRDHATTTVDIYETGTVDGDISSLRPTASDNDYIYQSVTVGTDSAIAITRRTSLPLKSQVNDPRLVTRLFLIKEGTRIEITTYDNRLVTLQDLIQLASVLAPAK